MQTLVKNIKIITMDDAQMVVDRGHIFIEDDRITAVSEDIPADYCPDQVLDGTHQLAVPGLINAHTHVGMAPLRNYADDLPLEEWLFQKIFPMEDKLTAEDVYWASLASIVEMLRTGTTCFADMYMYMDQVAQACEEAGIRANLARGLQCFDSAFDPFTDRRLQEAKELVEAWNGAASGRIHVRLGPHAVYTCVPRYLESTVALAKDLGVGVHIHLSETAKEVEDCTSTYGKTPTALLESLGLFDVPTLAAHGVHLSPADLAILAAYDVSVVHNPGSNLKLGSGIAPLKKLVQHQINIALGTDSAASNNNLNMLEEVYLAAVLHKGVEQDPSLVSASEAMQMATVGGARALGLESMVGQLKAGMKADLVLFDIDKPHYYPMYDPVTSLVYSGQAADVDTVFVDGQILLRHGECTMVDQEAIQAHMVQLCRRIAER